MHRFGRAALHVPVGLANALLVYVSPVLGLCFGLAFTAYEVLEEWRIRDKGWLDLQGYLWGLVAGGALWLALRSVLLPA